MTRWSFRGGWGLTARAVPYYAGPSWSGPCQYAEWTLDIFLAKADYFRLMAGRGVTWHRATSALLGDGRYYVHDLELTGEQAERIRSREHPLAVLLPLMYARALTLEEMMAR